MVKDALFLFIHHLSAIIVLFAIAFREPSARQEMVMEITESALFFEEVSMDPGRPWSQVSLRGWRAIRVMLEVSRMY